MTTHRICIATGAIAGAATCLLLGAATTAAAAQRDAETSNLAASNRIETMVVTGSRRDQRTVFSSMAPIDVIQAEALDITASEDLADSLAQLVPSFNVQRLPLNDGLIFVRPATLRGLSPDHTLVLLNGKRRHRSALLGSNGAQAPDLAMIPSFAIERIEVLRDGASAQYGSDAVAGVINLILDDDPGLRGFGQFSEYYEGDGTGYRAGVQAGTALGTDGSLVVTLEYADNDATSRSRQRPDAVELQAANPDLNIPNPVQNWGQPERDSLKLIWNGEVPLAESGSAYLFGTYAEGEGVSDFNWRNPASTSAFNPSDAFPGFDLTDVYPTGFTPRFGQEDTDFSVVGGLEGRVFNDGVGWDLSASYGANEIDYFIDQTINASLGPQSPTSFDPGTLEQREFNLNLDFTYELALDGLYQPALVAFGAERREETYEIKAGDPASFAIGPGAEDGLPSGSNGFPGYSEDQAGESEQTSYAAYLDVELPLSQRFTVGAAGRYEDYSEFGDSVTGKLSGRVELTDNLALRATASTGFRAPTPGQLFGERTSQGLDTETLNIFTRGRFSPEGPVAQILSERADVTIEPLDAEESTNLSIGLAYQNDLGFGATVDVYQVEVDDRFGTSQTYTLTDAERAALIDLGVPGGEGITSVNFFQNDFDTRTRGVDIVAFYDLPAGDGNLRLSGAYNFNDTEVTGGSLESDDVSRQRFEDNLPEHTGNVAATWTRGPLELMGRARYYGEWTDFAFNADGDIFQEFGAEVFVDVAVTYYPTDTLTLRLGAENVFDAYPDEADFQANRGLIYSRNAPYDTDGGLVYFRVDVDLP